MGTNVGVNTQVGTRTTLNDSHARSWTHLDFHFLELHKSTLGFLLTLLAVIGGVVALWWLCRKYRKHTTSNSNANAGMLPVYYQHQGGYVQPIQMQGGYVQPLPLPPRGFQPPHIYSQPEGQEEMEQTGAIKKPRFSGYQQSSQSQTSMRG